MKKYWIIFASLMLIFIGIMVAPSVAYALPYNSETVGPNGELVPTQQIYIPSEKIVIPYEYKDASGNYDSFSGSEDMCIDEENEKIFVADTLKKRVVVLNFAGTEATFIEGYEDTLFEYPCGISSNDEYLVVCDKTLKSLVIFDKNTLEYIKTITRPDSTLIGTDTEFIPLKTSIDNRGNIYVVSEGNSKGVMQLNFKGEFAGYIGANETPSDVLSWIKNLFGVSNNSDTYARGRSVTNIAIDSKGLVYTVTNQASSNVIKKLNTTGNAILSPSVNMINTVHINVDNSDNIFSLQSDGYVTIFDSYGNLLFKFGGESTEEVLGILKSPVAIATTTNHEIYVLDKEAKMIIKYEPTQFANLVFKAVDYYKDGLYLEGEDTWLEVLRYNSKFILAYKALARANMKKGNYNLALEQFKLAEDKAGYSEAYWQIRDTWLRANLGYVLLPIVLLVVLVIVYKFIAKKKPALVAPFRRGLGKINDAPLIGDLAFGRMFLRDSREAVYEIKYKGKAGIISATILYIWFVALQILQVYLKGYLFNNTNVYDSNALEIILVSTLPLLFIVIANYFVSTVSDGEGKFKQVYISFIYALMPYLVFALPIFLISNVLTYNEEVIYNLLNILMYGWCAINIILVIMELHDYNLWKTIKNIILTAVCVVFALAMAFIIYMLAYQLIVYIITVIKEIRA